MSAKIPFDKEKFLNACSCGCSRDRQAILDGIDKYKDSDPKLVRYLEWYRDEMWEKQVQEDIFRSQRANLGEENYNKKVAATLRALADKIEEPGHHFLIHAELPPLPIFSGKDHVESYFSHLNVTLVAGPLGG